MTSEKTANAFNHRAAGWQSGPVAENQSAARAALESRAGRTFSDMEWDGARARMLEFAVILRAWHLRVTIGESELRKAA
jgi:hypothetical protein